MERPMPPIRDSWKNLTWWQKSLAVTASCVALYAAFGFLLLPRIANYVLVEKVSPALNRQISVGEIRVNPFAMTADVSDFAISEPGVNGARTLRSACPQRPWLMGAPYRRPKSIPTDP